MHPFQPAISLLSFQRPTRELQPGLIEVVAKLVSTRHPDHHWSCIGNQAEALFALTNRVLGLTALCDVHSHANHARRLAIRCVIVFSSGSDPAYRAVRVNDTKFRRVRLPVSLGINDRLLDE